MISVVIPAYKNREMLEKNLAHNLPYLVDCGVIVVNDYPQESLKEVLKKFKKITLIENNENLGFGGAVNKGVRAAQGEHILLLNSDVILNNSDFTKSIHYFKKNKNVFAVSFAQIEKDGEVVGKNRIYWKDGFFHHSKALDIKEGINAWAEGGACLIDRNKFLQLGGFDSLYSPFYWEDVDLSYRAWKVGYQIIFDPKTQVMHHHESTIGKYFDSDKIKKIALRNQLIFIWKNITDKELIREHLATFLRRKISVSSLFAALLLLPEILKQRKRQKKYFIMSDEEILRKFNA